MNHSAPKNVKTHQIAELSIEEFFIQYKDTEHRRLKIFISKGIECFNGCGRSATRFVTWTQDNGTVHHDLVIDSFDDNIMLMTIDHTIPVSKGGTNNDSNRVPMCARCNEKKADKIVA